jgi:hypothetical protein
MINSYITNIYLQHMPKVSAKKEPRERYIKYFSDLYQFHQEDLSYDSFQDGAQYTNITIGDAIFTALKKEHHLSSFDLMIIANWSCDFDPDYAATGPYFLWRHQFDCNNFDISEQGTLGPLTALKIIKQYQTLQNSKKAMLLVTEQTTIPRNKERYDLIPAQDGGVALCLQTTTDKCRASLKILDIGFIYEANLLNHGLNLPKIIEEIKTRFGITKTEISVFVSKISLTYKSLQFYQNCNGTAPSSIQQYFDSRPGCLPLFECINKILLLNTAPTKNFLLFCEDSESAETAYILLEKV